MSEKLEQSGQEPNQEQSEQIEQAREAARKGVESFLEAFKNDSWVGDEKTVELFRDRYRRDSMGKMSLGDFKKHLAKMIEELNTSTSRREITAVCRKLPEAVNIGYGGSEDMHYYKGGWRGKSAGYPNFDDGTNKPPPF